MLCSIGWVIQCRVSFPPIATRRVPDPLNPRRFVLGAARKLLFDGRDPEEVLREVAELEQRSDAPRLTPEAIERTRMSRSRDRIMANLEEMYREAFDRARAAGDETQMSTLDFAYRREQLYLELLLDIRDALERR
jgi:hypothetical protein